MALTQIPRFEGEKFDLRVQNLVESYLLNNPPSSPEEREEDIKYFTELFSHLDLEDIDEITKIERRLKTNPTIRQTES